jgi:hypothetical protein
LDNTESGQDAERQMEHFCRKWWIGFVGYVKRIAKERRAKKEQENSTDRAARRTAWATIAIAFFTLVQVGVGLVTWKVLNGQLKEMHDGGVDTHTLAQAADTQAKKMSDVSTAADKIREAAQNMVGEDERIADNAKETLETNNRNAQATLAASNKQAKDALDAAIAQYKLDERAWIGIGSFRSVQFGKGQSWKVDVDIFNSGKTPALQLEQASEFGVELGFPVKNVPTDWFASMQFTPAEAIPPQGRYTIHAEIPEQVISQVYDAVKSKDRTIYIYGGIRYKDISGGDGYTEYCFLMSDPDKSDLAFCNSHNEMK